MQMVRGGPGGRRAVLPRLPRKPAGARPVVARAGSQRADRCRQRLCLEHRAPRSLESRGRAGGRPSCCRIAGPDYDRRQNRPSPFPGGYLPVALSDAHNNPAAYAYCGTHKHRNARANPYRNAGAYCDCDPGADRHANADAASHRDS